MVYLLYDILLLLSSLFLIPFYLIRGVRYGKTRRGVRERLGFFEPGRLFSLAGRDVIWVHAVSVGETRAATPLVRALKKAYPRKAILLSNVTETGRAVAGAIGEVDLCIFFPFDLSWCVRRVLKLVSPSLVVIVETEIWPNFVREAGRQGIPLLLANGRISDRSFPRYRTARSLLEPILSNISSFCMQSERDADRIRMIGALPSKVITTGNLKFDMQSPQLSEPVQLREDYRISDDVKVWVAGSTHPGEEEIILDVFSRMINEQRKLILILVPRHPERSQAIGGLIAGKKMRYVMRSDLNNCYPLLTSGDVLLGDTMGEMLRFYAVSDFVFVGGSFVDVGGHNILEASLLKKPVVFGPRMHNFREISRLLLDADGGVMAMDSDDLARIVCQFLDDENLRESMGNKGFALLERNSGATRRTMEAIDSLLEHCGG